MDRGTASSKRTIPRNGKHVQEPSITEIQPRADPCRSILIFADACPVQRTNVERQAETVSLSSRRKIKLIPSLNCFGYMTVLFFCRGGSASSSPMSSTGVGVWDELSFAMKDRAACSIVGQATPTIVTPWKIAGLTVLKMF